MRGHAGALQRRPRVLTLGNLLDQKVKALFLECAAAGDAFVENRPQAVLIAAGVGLAGGAQLLGRQVMHRAHGGRRAGQRARA